MHYKTRIVCLKTEIGMTILNAGVYSHYKGLFVTEV